VLRKQAYPLDSTSKGRGGKALGKNLYTVEVKMVGANIKDRIPVKADSIKEAKRIMEKEFPELEVTKVTKAQKVSRKSAKMVMTPEGPALKTDGLLIKPKGESPRAIRPIEKDGAKSTRVAKILEERGKRKYVVTWTGKDGKIKSRTFVRKLRARRFASGKVGKDVGLGWAEGDKIKFLEEKDLRKLWFKPKKHRGWKKSQRAETRRQKLLASTDKRQSLINRYLEASRAMTALANVTTDADTKIKANADAKYFHTAARMRSLRKAEGSPEHTNKKR